VILFDELQLIQYQVYDVIGMDGVGLEDRMKYLRDTISSSSNIRVVDTFQCEGESHLKTTLSRAVANGSDGLLLRRPNSFYEHHKSDSMLQLSVIYFKHISLSDSFTFQRPFMDQAVVVHESSDKSRILCQK
jgi:hypothetical protein